MPPKAPELDPEWIEKIEPIIPKGKPESVLAVRKVMKELDAVKVQSLKDVKPELEQGLDVNNIMIPMRDSVEIPLRIIKPHGDKIRPVYIGYHGGGWTAGSNDSEELLNRQLAKGADVLVFSVEYRLAPENPYPIPLDDAEDAMKWVSENASRFGGDVKKGLVVGGTSAGGHLSAVCAYRGVAKGIPVTGLLLRIPVVLSHDVAKEEWKETLSMLPRDTYTPMVTFEAVERTFEHLGVPHDKLSDPWSFPIFAKSFDNFPRTYIQCAGLDPLGPEGVLFEKVLREHDVETKIDYYPNLPHMYHMYLQLSGARKALEDITNGVRWLFRL